MFRSGQFEKLVEKATSHLIMEPDWKINMEICDQIRQNDIPPKTALQILKKRLAFQNPNAAMHALLLLETMVKNCGAAFHEELTAPAYCEFLHDLVKTTQYENVRDKLLGLIHAWCTAFRKNHKCGSLGETMVAMKAEGFKFPVHSESDAMFSANTAPAWKEGDKCHRCRTSFTMLTRRHHCRSCGQVFCGNCSEKSSAIPDYGIEKPVRVCDGCFAKLNKVPAAPKAVVEKETELPEDYLRSPLAQQSQQPPRKTEEELKEEEELQLAIALSQSEAEHKEKEKRKSHVDDFFGSSKKAQNRTQSPQRASTPPDDFTAGNPEMVRYLNRQYWEAKADAVDHRNVNNSGGAISPSAPVPTPSPASTIGGSTGVSTSIKDFSVYGLVAPRQNGASATALGAVDIEMEEFVSTLRSQVEVFINRMKSNSSRGRYIANDSSVQTLFMNITAMHSRLLRYIQDHDDSRLHYERLQDKLTQVKDARAALDDLRQEHYDKLRREAEEAERLRQMQMANKLDIMRKKKQEYLQYQRQLALQRIQEQEHEMAMRQEQQKQHYMLAQQPGAPSYLPPGAVPPGYHPHHPLHMAGQPTGNSPTHGAPYVGGATLPGHTTTGTYPTFQYGAPMMTPMPQGPPTTVPGAPGMGPTQQSMIPGSMQPPMTGSAGQQASIYQPGPPMSVGLPQTRMMMQPPNSSQPQHFPPQPPPPGILQQQQQPMGMPPQNMPGPGQSQQMAPPGMGMMPSQYQQMPPQQQQQQHEPDTQTGELITFD